MRVGANSGETTSNRRDSNKRYAAMITGAFVVIGAVVAAGFCWSGNCQLASTSSSLPPFTEIANSTPSEQPTIAPSLAPGTLVVGKCSGDIGSGYGGDFCSPSFECTLCPGSYPGEGLHPRACFDSGLPLSLLQSYCRQLNDTRTRPCGSEPNCEAENYCVDCAGYAPAGTLQGYRCVDEDVYVSDGSLVYVDCLVENTNVDDLLPIVLQIALPDSDSEKISWFLKCQNLRTFVWTEIRSVPAGTSTIPGQVVEEDVAVPFGHNCTWQVKGARDEMSSQAVVRAVRLKHTSHGPERTQRTGYFGEMATVTSFALSAPASRWEWY